MKPKNFPARKLWRKIRAKRFETRCLTDTEIKELDEARKIRTKKNRI